MTVLAHEIRLVTKEEFDELVWKRKIGFHFICYSPEDKGYVACCHNFVNGSNYTAGEVFEYEWDAVEWIQSEEDSGEEVEE